MTQAELPAFRKRILQWYGEHKRALPWREDPTPYHVWLSEIILQQTRVDQGMSYYLRFIEHYPSVEDLASAEEDEVLKMWQGLGYYNRARNLYAAAKKISLELDGKFPSDYSALLELPGFGPYTAAAIASIAFNQPHAVVDGNVIRVISRLFGIEDPVDDPATLRQINTAADSLLSLKHPGDYNQAMMEFGAMQCTPTNPECGQCCLRSFCTGFAQGIQNQIPIKRKKLVKRPRYLHFLVLDDGKHTYLEQRGTDDIWSRLFQFPMVETQKDGPLESEELQEHIGTDFVVDRVDVPKKHILSHQELHARFYRIRIHAQPSIKVRRVAWNEVGSFALPRLIDRYLENSMERAGSKRGE